MRILCPLRLPVHDYGIIRGWPEIGCDVRVLDGRPLTRQELAAAIEEYRPDLLFSYGWWHGCLWPEDLAWACAAYHLPHATWANDDPTHFAYTSLPLARTADLVFTTTEELRPSYAAIGKKTAFLQFACNPDLHHRVAVGVKEHHNIVLIAHNYSRFDSEGRTYRTRSARLMLEPLIQQGYDVRAFGDGWGDAAQPVHVPPQNARAVVPYPNLAAIYSGAKIVLGLQTECHWRTQTSCRLFEVLGCGAFHLAPLTRATDRLFIQGKHLVMSRTPGETVAIARYYLERDRERTAIAAAGQLEVYRKHTYRHRAAEFMAVVSKEL